LLILLKETIMARPKKTTTKKTTSTRGRKATPKTKARTPKPMTVPHDASTSSPHHRVEAIKGFIGEAA
jgi:hypothetical protein